MQHYATTYNNKILCMAHHGSRWLAEQKLSEWPTSTGLRRLMGIKNGSCQSVATITKQDGSGESQICNILPDHILPKLVQCATIYRNTDHQKIGTGWHRKGQDKTKCASRSSFAAGRSALTCSLTQLELERITVYHIILHTFTYYRLLQYHIITIHHIISQDLNISQYMTFCLAEACFR